MRGSGGVSEAQSLNTAPSVHTRLLESLIAAA